jgi:MFS family permease
MTTAASRARLGVSVVFAVSGAAFATWAARIPAVQDRLGLSAGELAIGLFGLACGAVLALLGSGPLLAKIGSRAGVVIGAIVLCGGLALVAFAPDLPVLVGLLAVFGAGNSLLDVSMNVHAARVEADYGRSIFAGFHALWSIGGLLGSGLAALLASWRTPITVHFPVLGGLLLLVALWAVRDGFLTGPDQGQGGSAFALPGRGLLILGLMGFCGFVVEGTVNDWSAEYLRKVTDASAALASLGYFVFSITMIVVRLMTDRIVLHTGAVRFIRVAGLVVFAGYLLIVLVPVFGAGLAGFAVIGIGTAGVVPLVWSAAGRKRPDASGNGIAAVATCGYLGSLVGPVLIGGLIEAVGLRLALAAVGVLALPIVLLAPELRASTGTAASGDRAARGTSPPYDL